MVFDLHNPTPDDLQETVQALSQEAKQNPKQLVYVSIGILSDRDVSLYKEHLADITRAIREMIITLNTPAADGNCAYDVRASKYYRETPTTENAGAYGYGWVTEYFITMKYIPSRYPNIRIDDLEGRV